MALALTYTYIHTHVIQSYNRSICDTLLAEKNQLNREIDRDLLARSDGLLNGLYAIGAKRCVEELNISVSAYE